MIQKKLVVISASWILVLALISVFIVKSNYVARENDSRLYSKFTAQLAKKPISEMLALEWKNSSVYAETETPYVRDHLIGQFIFPVLMVKSGVSQKHAIYIVNTIYKLLSLLLMFLIARRFYSDKVSALLTVLIQIIPVSLNYQMRANHEPALLLLTLGVILGAMNIRSNKKYFILIAFCINFCFLIKGLAFLPILPITLASYLIYNYFEKSICKKDIAYLGLVFSSIIILAIGYEFYFRYLTGFNFFEQYYQVQFVNRSFKAVESTVPLLNNIKAVAYYSSRLLSYSLPWSLFALILLVKDKFIIKSMNEKKFYSMMIAGSLIYILTFSISGRLASRYIYPAYYLFSSACILFVLKRFESKIKLSPYTSSMISATLFLILTFVSIYKGSGNHLIYPH